MATRAYITKDSTKEEIYQAYIDMQKKLKATVFHKKEIQNKVAEVRKEKNKKYNELRYQVLKRDQKIYRMQQHIFNLQRFAVNERHKAKQKGIELGKGKVRKVDYSVIKMYEFLLQVEQVSNILGMKLSHCAFLLWAGRYEFFNFKDYQKDHNSNATGFQTMVNRFMKSGHLVKVSTDNVKKNYALSGSGISLFDKIDKFTKKHFNE
jgi:hypothetical protein